NADTTSELIWTAPFCTPAGTLVAVTVTVTNSSNLSTSETFTISTTPCPAPMLSSKEAHSVMLKGDGTVWAWGANDYGQLGDGTTTSSLTPVQFMGLSGITALAAGAYHSLARRNDGTVWA